MSSSRVYRYRDPAAVALGLRELRKKGLTPRGLLFVALDPRGETHIVVPEDFDAVYNIRVGDKLTLEAPLVGRYFYFDSVHRLPGDTVLWNGDRRLSDTGSAPEVATALAFWLKGASAKNVILGCTPHQPGAWWTKDERSHVIDLHASGLVDAVVISSGILARRIGSPGLFYLSFAALRAGGVRTEWIELFQSPLGNVLMLERRVVNYRLALTCERGLLELDVSGLPEEIRQTSQTVVDQPIGILGRIDGGAFAVTSGEIEPWGLANIGPAQLVGSSAQSLDELPGALAAAVTIPPS